MSDYTLGLLSVSTGNFLGWYHAAEEARRDLDRWIAAEPEAAGELEIVEFDAEGMPV